MKQIMTLTFFCLGYILNLEAKSYDLSSPDNIIKVSIEIKDRIYYSISWQNIQIIEPSAISMVLDGNLILGHDPKVKKVVTNFIDDKIYPPVREKRKEIIDRYNEMELSFAGNWGLIFRAYDDGISWRFTTDFKNDLTLGSDSFS